MASLNFRKENTVCPNVFTTGMPRTYSTASFDISERAQAYCSGHRQQGRQEAHHSDPGIHHCRRLCVHVDSEFLPEHNIHKRHKKYLGIKTPGAMLQIE